MSGWMARTTLEMLGQTNLGYSLDNFAQDSQDPFGESLKMFLYVVYLFPSHPWDSGFRSVS